MTTGTLSFNEIASIMGLTRRSLTMFCEHKGGTESGMMREIHYARTNKERDRVDEAAFYLWLASRGGYSPNGLPKDRVRQTSCVTQTTERQLCNSVDFAAFRKGLIEAGWFEKADDRGLEYFRGNDRIDFMAYYVEEHWSDGLIDRRAYTYTYITGALRYEKKRYRSYPSFEEFVSKAMVNMFDRKSAKLSGLSFCEYALAPVVA